MSSMTNTDCATIALAENCVNCDKEIPLDEAMIAFILRTGCEALTCSPRCRAENIGLKAA